MTAHDLRTTFDITDLASNILQSEKNRSVNCCKIGRDVGGAVTSTAMYCSRHNLAQQDFSAKRVRRRKKANDEPSNDNIEQNPTAKYRWEIFKHANDKALASIETQFSRHAFHNMANNCSLSTFHLREEYISLNRIYEKIKRERPP